jgi:hypothetical protein
MENVRFALTISFVLACCAVYSQVPTQVQSGPTTSPNPNGGEPFPHAAATVNKVCGEDIPPPYHPPPVIQGRCLAVKEYMRYPSPISPIGDLTLSMMGDETAFYLFGIIWKSPPLTVAQTVTVLDIIHNSFKSPVFIRSHADRKPEKSLALLKMLQATAVDQAVKERIAAETTFLTTLPDKVTPVPILNLPSKPGVMPMQEDFPKP